MYFQMACDCDIYSHSNICLREKFEAGIYLRTQRDNIAQCFLVGNVVLFDSHRDAIHAFPESLVSY